MPSKRVKVLLIEDSDLMRMMISEIINAESDLELIGTASNGKEGYELTLKLQPDVVVTDVVMPEYDGVYAVKHIMRDNPTPVILLSALDKASPQVFEALNEGAVDFIDKPRQSEADLFKCPEFKLVDAIRLASQANTAGLLNLKLKQNNYIHRFDEHLKYDIVCIGASTGGPSVIESIIKTLPANMIVPVVIAQHMPHRFILSYIKRLNNQTPLTVKLAENNEKLQAGFVYLCPGSSNLIFRKSKGTGAISFRYSDQDFEAFNNPSIDSIMLSAAKVCGKRTIGIILSGMGRDGKLGLEAIHRAGGFTIAQDELSCVVYGMAKYAVDSGVITQVVPQNEISGFLVGCL